MYVPYSGIINVRTVCMIDFICRGLNNRLHFYNVPVVSGLFTAIIQIDRYPDPEEHYIMLCVLESGSSELIIRGI